MTEKLNKESMWEYYEDHVTADFFTAVWLQYELGTISDVQLVEILDEESVEEK